MTINTPDDQQRIHEQRERNAKRPNNPNIDPFTSGYAHARVEQISNGLNNIENAIPNQLIVRGEKSGSKVAGRWMEQVETISEEPIINKDAISRSLSPETPDILDQEYLAKQSVIKAQLEIERIFKER